MILRILLRMQHLTRNPGPKKGHHIARVNHRPGIRIFVIAIMYSVNRRRRLSLECCQFWGSLDLLRTLYCVSAVHRPRCGTGPLFFSPPVSPSPPSSQLPVWAKADCQLVAVLSGPPAVVGCWHWPPGGIRHLPQSQSSHPICLLGRRGRSPRQGTLCVITYPLTASRHLLKAVMSSEVRRTPVFYAVPVPLCYRAGPAPALRPGRGALGGLGAFVIRQLGPVAFPITTRRDTARLGG